jgi:hypothetical protein
MSTPLLETERTTEEIREPTIDTPATSRKLRGLRIERLRAMTHAEKFERMRDLSRFVEMLVRADVRRLHPEADEREILLRIASRRVPAELLKRAFGWDVKDKGY